MKMLVVCHRSRALLAAGLALVLLFPGLGAAKDPQPAAKPGPSREAALAQLVRGTSTQADVERVLGYPSGIGGSRLPPDWQTRDIWFYESIKVGKVTPEPQSGAQTYRTIHIDLNQDILLVFFAGERFDGYMWYANIGAAEGRTPKE